MQSPRQSGKAARFGFFVPVAMLLALAGWLAPTALAQTAAPLLVLPWEPGQFVQARGEANFFDNGHTKETGEGFHLTQYESAGRVRLMDKYEVNPSIGYQLQYLNIDSPSAVLPNQLVDAGVAVGSPLGKSDPWFVMLTVGIGYAGNSPFHDSHAYYGAADLIVGRRVDWPVKGGNLLFILDYNGNRGFLPDVPIPAVVFSNRFNDQLKFVVGLPYSTLTYQPLNGLVIEGRYTLIDSFEATIGYEFIKHFTVFGNYNSRFNGFHVDKSPIEGLANNPDRRLFFRQNRAEIGLRWSPNDHIDASVAGGYAFNQNFSTGFDSRNLELVQHVSDEPYVRFQVGLSF